MKYSFNPPKAAKESGEVALAQRYDINVSYKDLGAVCDAVRYRDVETALKILDDVINMRSAILYRRHNKHMGSRHELGGKKGKYPKKAANEVRLAILNAMANAGNRGNLDAEKMFVIHASGNKTHIERRSPSKGSIAWGRGMYGRSAINHSDIEYAKVEIGLASMDYSGISENAKKMIAIKSRQVRHPKKTEKAAAPKKKEKKEVPKTEKPKPAAIAAEATTK